MRSQTPPPGDRPPDPRPSRHRMETTTQDSSPKPTINHYLKTYITPPPRLMRCRTVFPEDAGIGTTPAKAASILTRPGCDHAVSATAATTGPIPGWWRRAAAGPRRARSVIRSVTSPSSLSSAVTRWASLIAPPRAVRVARSSLRVLHAVTVTTRVAVSGWRASMPGSTTRSSAVNASIVAVRSGSCGRGRPAAPRRRRGGHRRLVVRAAACPGAGAPRRQCGGSSPPSRTRRCRGSRGRSCAGPRRPRVQHPMRRAPDAPHRCQHPEHTGIATGASRGPGHGA